MDFSWSSEEEAFRQEILGFLKAELPEGWNETLVLDKESEEYMDIAKTFTRKLGSKGWYTAHWPEESPVERSWAPISLCDHQRSSN